MQEMARITASELEQFIVATVELTGRALGAGTYGSVEEVEIPGATVAAKKLHQQLVNLGSPQQIEKWVTDFVEECRLMSQLRHPHIVQFLGVCYLPGAQLPVLLMEKLQTSLENLLETSPRIPIDLKVHLLTGTGRGVVYLHSRTPPISHCNLTARNILVDNGLNAKVADLGVSRIVNIQPSRLAACASMPGTGVYMPPEAAQEEGVTRYNTAIDIFSFGVVSLFTLTQTFPKDLKPAAYYDPVTQRVLGQTKIERHKDYIVPMKTALGETHPLVQLTLDCLEFLPEDRPPAVMVLRRLEEVGTTLSQNCTQTKLELIQQVAGKEEEVQRVAADAERVKQGANKVLHLEEMKQKHVEINQLQKEFSSQVNQLQGSIDRLQAEKRAQINALQATVDEKQDQVCGLEELTTLQQEQLEVQRREIDRLFSSVRSLQIQQGSGQETTKKTTKAIKSIDSSTGNELLPHKSTTPQPTVPTAITFNWTRCKDIPRKMDVMGQPVAINGKLYMRGRSNFAETVHELGDLKSLLASNSMVQVLAAEETSSDDEICSSVTDAHAHRPSRALFDAAKRGNIAEVEKLHSKGAKLTATDINGWTPLHHAARLQKKEVVQYIVNNVSKTTLDIAEDERVQTALHKAAWFGYVDICKILVEAGASLDKQDYKGNTPYDKAVQSGDTELRMYLKPLSMLKHQGELPPPSVSGFTIATLRSQLLVVGGRDKSTKENTNTILTFDESSRQWVQSFPPMPKAITLPKVVGYRNHLIVIGGYDSNSTRIADVSILNTGNKWITVKPLPSTDDYSTCLIGDTLYLVGQSTKEVFRAHVPSLMSRASSGVWESVASVPFYWSSLIAIGNTVLTVGGKDSKELRGMAISSIHLYNPTKDQWTQCGNLPEKMKCRYCIELSGKLCVLGGSSLYTSIYITSITH